MKNTPIEQDDNETVLGSTAEWELTMDGTTFDLRRCTNCGFTADFPKDMSSCIWRRCPNCNKEMRW